VNASPASASQPARSQADIEWAEIAATAPQLAQTMRRYLRQAATFLAPASVDVADNSLRIFARWLLADTTVVAVADVTRDAIEDFKVYLAARPGNRGGSLSENTQRQRLRTLRVFFERIIEWDWADTPPRNPILNWDLPKRPEPLPKFLDDADAAKFMLAARASKDPRDRLIVELLARTECAAVSLLGYKTSMLVKPFYRVSPVQARILGCPPMPLLGRALDLERQLGEDRRPDRRLLPGFRVGAAPVLDLVSHESPPTRLSRFR
jgi:hypothetical protein